MGLKPQSFIVKEYGDPQAGLTPIKLSNKLSQQELIELFLLFLRLFLYNKEHQLLQRL